ncbi:DNA-binding transcriptional regulator GbsR, MarR family [Virgibacillus subterraneus]|uniref:HTH-type transcriptional regulator n=1 Tax=Virgibacillus subterraneus TaxID=621109 RepID=A0A1H9FTR9_9BACI|nr:transcriptional regulator [Virgibacillus subterraneus]SEQ41266.1 DNA-binding transcriptional regulator GbsR, MarR family [Virgibacillus subterraneus]
MFEPSTENLTNKILIEFAKTIEMFGLTPLESRLFAYMYLVEKPMTLDEMSNGLGKSKTSMSTSIRSLSDLNLVTLVWKKGVRKDLYEANTELFKNFMSFYVNKWFDAVNHQKDSLEEIIKKLKQHETEHEPDTYEKLLKIINFHKQVESSFQNMGQG